MQHARIDNIVKAKEAWKLRMDGVETDKIAKKLSLTPNTVSEIMKYTDFDYYATPTKEPSYYDTKLMLLRRISNDTNKLKESNSSIESKKKIFSILFQATLILTALLILI